MCVLERGGGGGERLLTRVVCQWFAFSSFFSSFSSSSSSSSFFFFFFFPFSFFAGIFRTVFRDMFQAVSLASFPGASSHLNSWRELKLLSGSEQEEKEKEERKRNNRHHHPLLPIMFYSARSQFRTWIFCRRGTPVYCDSRCVECTRRWRCASVRWNIICWSWSYYQESVRWNIRVSVEVRITVKSRLSVGTSGLHKLELLSSVWVIEGDWEVGVKFPHFTFEEFVKWQSKRFVMADWFSCTVWWVATAFSLV